MSWQFSFISYNKHSRLFYVFAPALVTPKQTAKNLFSTFIFFYFTIFLVRQLNLQVFINNYHLHRFYIRAQNLCMCKHLLRYTAKLYNTPNCIISFEPETEAGG